MKPNLCFFTQTRRKWYTQNYLNNIEIKRVDFFNFLGLQLNHNLNWNKHVNYVSLKISKISGILYRLRSEFPTYILKSIYNTLLLPHLTYCILSWGSQIGKIHLFQKRAIRNVTKSAYNAHTEPLHREQNILKVHDLYRLFYFTLVNNNLPHYFKRFRPQFSLGHMHYNLRNPVRQPPMIKNEFPK